MSSLVKQKSISLYHIKKQDKEKTRREIEKKTSGLM